MRHYLGLHIAPVYCTRTASRLCRTYTDKHGYKDLCRELLNVDISKQQQTSDWGAATLSPEQIEYAASDVLYLHRLKAKLEVMIAREGPQGINGCLLRFPAVPRRARPRRIRERRYFRA